MNKQQLITTGIIGIALYLISTGVSYAAFSFFGKASPPKAIPTPLSTNGQPTQGFRIDPSIPKTETCPLNGAPYTKQERDVWEKRRPLAVMIENHAESRPQSGLSYADVVYEAVAEGGITRFMGVFYCDAAYKSVNLAPVRSARTYYLPWVLEYDALYNHVGGAGRCPDDTVDERAKALCQIEQYKIKDMDQFGISFPIVLITPSQQSIRWSAPQISYINLRPTGVGQMSIPKVSHGTKILHHGSLKTTQKRQIAEHLFPHRLSHGKDTKRSMAYDGTMKKRQTLTFVSTGENHTWIWKQKNNFEQKQSRSCLQKKQDQLTSMRICCIPTSGAGTG